MAYPSTRAYLRKWGLIAMALAAPLLDVAMTRGQQLPSLDEAIALHDAGQYAEAFDMFLPLAEAGVIKAQNRIAHMYYWGEGTAKDPQKHHEWAMRSAELGDPYGEFDVATAYFSGRLFPADKELGLEWLTKSAEGEDRYALLALGLMYVYGDLVPKDLQRGTELVRQAAAAGDPQAQKTLGALLVYGEAATPQTRRAGLKWLWRAARQREPAAQYMLSDLSLTSGPTPDVAQAGTWLILAVNGGCAAAGPALYSLFSMISDEEELAAIEHAVTWDESTAPKDPHDHRLAGAICDVRPQAQAWR